MIIERYSSKQEGFIHALTATATKEHVKITLIETMRASCESEAIGLFEDWIDENLEGFDFDWEITCDEVKGDSNEV